MKDEQIKVNFFCTILPFGHVSIITRGVEEAHEVKEKESSQHGVPKTTSPQLLEITFDGENYYCIPQTTGGCF